MTPVRKIRKKLIGQLELSLYFLLEKANKKFTKAIESGRSKTDTFEKIANSYKTIVGLIEHNRQISIMSPLLDAYYLEAKLGVLQSTTKGLPQEPITSKTVANNDRKLDQIKESLDRLCSKAINFSRESSLYRKNNKFSLDCKDLITRIQEYGNAWKITASQRKAIYYYNYALHLIEQARVKNIEKSIDRLQQSIIYLELSCNAYRNIPKSNADIEAVVSLIEETNRQIQTLTPLQTSNKETCKTQNRQIFDNLNRLELDDRQAQAHSSVSSELGLLPSRKPLAEKRKLSQSEEFFSKKPKAELVNTLTHHDFLETHEKQTQAWEEEIKKSLKQIPLDSHTYLRYSALFFKLVNTITMVSKESANHSLLTKLSWLDIAKNLMALSSNKDLPLSDNITSQINLLTKKYHKQLQIISAQKRAAAYPSYSELYLKTQNPQDLLSEEVLDYYHGLEAFQLHEDGIIFMSTIPTLINNECRHRFTIPNMLKQIESSIHSFDKNSKNLFYATLFRELVKFYIFPKNKAWLLTHTAVATHPSALNDELNKLLTAATNFAKAAGPEGIKIMDKITTLKTYLYQTRPDKNSYFALAETTFFQPATTITLESVLEKHLQFMLKFRQPSINPDTTSSHILKFIQQQCKTHSENGVVPQIQASP